MTKKQPPDQSTQPQDILSAPQRYFNWQNIRDIALIALIVVVAYKVAKAPWTVNIDRFSFTDLLSLFLALFSVWLSIMFYRMADSGSQRFYDQSFRFMNDASVVLGRIEAGFGTQLNHIAGQNTELQRALMGGEFAVKVKAQQVTEATEAVVQTAIAVSDGASLEEQARLIEGLRAKTDELSTARAKLAQAQKELTATKIASFAGGESGIILDFVLRQMYEIHRAASPEEPEPAHLEGEALNAKFRETAQGLPPHATKALLAEEFITEGGDLTVKGIDTLRKMVRFNNHY